MDRARGRIGDLGRFRFVGWDAGVLGSNANRPSCVRSRLCLELGEDYAVGDLTGQRQQMRRDAIETNRLLNEMLKVLRTETLKVRIIDSDKARGVQTPKPPRK